MAFKIYSKSQKIYRPIEWTVTFAVSGGTLEQQHDADNDLFYPDRTVTPTLIEPTFHIVDRDTKSSRDATAELINISWKQVVNGAAPVDCNTPDYDVATEGSVDRKKGSIIVNKNVSYLTTITLKFSAQYFDTKRKRTLKVEKDIPLTTASVASLLLHTKLDRPNTFLINPFYLDTPAQYQEVVTPFFQLGDEQLKDTSVIGGWWYVVEGGKETPVTPVEDVRVDSVDPKTFALTVDKRCIDDTLFRFKSSLHPDKKIPVTAPANAYVDDIRFIRKYPDGIKFEKVIGGDGFVSGDAKSTTGKVVVTGPKGIIPNPDKYWTCDWYVKDSAAGTTFNKVKTGFGPVKLPMTTDSIDIEIEIHEKGAYCLLVDDEGNTFVGENGEDIIVQKERR